MASNSMVRKQVYLTPSQDARLRRAAKRLQKSEAELLREAVERYLPASERAGIELEKDPLFRLVAVGSSSDRELSVRVDEVLYGDQKT